ncbi:hypothetical protein MVEN_00735300 [Mycena venus]|uniref:Uncharacterized protein n=1 Tax=Mycena venus TaxID=2733690 RepID=A0A8H7D5H3_9AGAR|nr:hypothetical protein MVEN_00735300 [Mycena venus]
MPLSADLAQELIDSILDFLHDDRESLLFSGLVARKWVPATRYHLFERITVNHFFTRRAGHFFRDSAHSFLEICRSPHCTIIPAIQDVILNVDTDPAPVMLRELVDMLRHAPISKILFIDHTKSFRDPISLTWMAPHFPGLREFVYNSLDRFVLDVFTLITSFPELHRLSLYSNTRHAAKSAITQATPYPTAIPPAALTHLRTLRLRLFSDQSAGFMAWLRTSGDRIQLETLDIDIFHFYHNGWGPVAPLNAFLSANGKYLRNFGLRIRDGELDLSGLTNLRTLSLSSHGVEAICTSLASLPSEPTLSSFEVAFREWIHYDDFPCACDPRFLVHEFADVMQGAQFARLTQFTILVPAFFGDGGREALREYFPRWKDTDVLSVGFIDRFRVPVDSWEGVRDKLVGLGEG